HGWSSVVIYCIPHSALEISDHGSRITYHASLHSHERERIPSRHVREDHLVAFLKTFQNLDRAHGSAAEFDADPRGIAAAINELEDAYGAFCLALHRTGHVEHILQPL